MRDRTAIVTVAVLVAALLPAASLRAQPSSARPPLQGGVSTTEPRPGPPFPQGSKLPSIDRTLTFSHNTRPAGVTLGPPSEPAGKTR